MPRGTVGTIPLTFQPNISKNSICIVVLFMECTIQTDLLGEQGISTNEKRHSLTEHLHF